MEEDRVSDYLSDEEQLERLRSWWQRNGIALLIGVLFAVAAVVGWRWYSGQQQAAIEAASLVYQKYVKASGSERDAAFERLESEYPATTYFTFALLRSAHDAVAENRHEAAADLLSRAAQQAPEALLADLANYRLAKVLQQLDRSDDALAVLAKVRSEGYRSQVAELKGDIHLARNELELAHEAYSAALASLEEGETRPVLEMKATNTANPYGV
jgi:predicted negative regulator of RcsB-dependent stress response